MRVSVPVHRPPRDSLRPRLAGDTVSVPVTTADIPGDGAAEVAGALGDPAGAVPAPPLAPLTPLAGPSPLFPFYERGGCYTLFGTGFDAESGGVLLTGSLDRPLWGVANDGSGYFGLLAQRPATAVEAVCSPATPCTLERLTLPKLRRVHRPPTHPFLAIRSRA